MQTYDKWRQPKMLHNTNLKQVHQMIPNDLVHHKVKITPNLLSMSLRPKYHRISFYVKLYFLICRPFWDTCTKWLLTTLNALRSRVLNIYFTRVPESYILSVFALSPARTGTPNGPKLTLNVTRWKIHHIFYYCLPISILSFVLLPILFELTAILTQVQIWDRNVSLYSQQFSSYMPFWDICTQWSPNVNPIRCADSCFRVTDHLRQVH